MRRTSRPHRSSEDEGVDRRFVVAGVGGGELRLRLERETLIDGVACTSGSSRTPQRTAASSRYFARTPCRMR